MQNNLNVYEEPTDIDIEIQIREEITRKRKLIDQDRDFLERERQYNIRESQGGRIESDTQRIQRLDAEIQDLEQREERHNQEREFRKNQQLREMKQQLRQQHEKEYNYKFESNEEFDEYLELLELDARKLEDAPIFQHQAVYKKELEDQYFITNNIGPSQPLSLKFLASRTLFEKFHGKAVNKEEQLTLEKLKILRTRKNYDIISYNLQYKKLVNNVQIVEIKNNRVDIPKYFVKADELEQDQNAYILLVTFGSIITIYLKESYIFARLKEDHGLIVKNLIMKSKTNRTLGIITNENALGMYVVEIYYHNNRAQKILIIRI